MNFSIRSGPMTASVDTAGYKQVSFKDGQTIKYNHNNDEVYGLFFGSFGHRLTGRIEYVDEGNGLKAYLDFGAYRLRK